MVRFVCFGVNVLVLGCYDVVWKMLFDVVMFLIDIDVFICIVKVVECGLIDVLFLVDGFGGLVEESFIWLWCVLDLVMLLLGLLQQIDYIGLVVMILIIFGYFYVVVCQIVLLDYILKGWVVWNIIISQMLVVLDVYGLDKGFSQDECYQCVREFVEIVIGLWDFVLQDVVVVSGDVFVDECCLCFIDVQGCYFWVCGSLLVIVLLQGCLVIFQVGQFEDSKVFGVCYVDVLFIGQCML